MIADFREDVRAGVVFEQNGFRPVWFSLHGSKVVVESVHYRWTERRASELVYKFTVSDGVNFYELEFSGRDMKWCVVAMG